MRQDLPRQLQELQDRLARAEARLSAPATPLLHDGATAMTFDGEGNGAQNSPYQQILPQPSRDIASLVPAQVQLVKGFEAGNSATDTLDTPMPEFDSETMDSQLID